MLNIGLRRLTYAVLDKDTPSELTYKLPTKALARSAIDLSRERAGGTVTFWAEDGLEWEGGTADNSTMTLQCVNIPAEALAEVTGSAIDANGVLIAGGDNAPFIALGWESYAVRGASDPEDTPQTAYEKVWAYKCKVKLGAYKRHTVEGTPTVQAATLNVTVFKTKYLQPDGTPHMDATIIAGTDVPDSVVEGWFEEPYQGAGIRSQEAGE